jgi:ubiquinone/menaquinone biosynthesis C-methylase UbiE
MEKTFQDIVPNYNDYLDRQNVKYMSHERDNPHWEAGQKRYLLQKFSHCQRDLRILDISCGDGVGLRVFKDLGFKNVVGVDYNEDKVKNARLTGYEVFQADMHVLDMFENSSFDIVYSSHTLEHAYSPLKVINEFHRILKPECLLYLVLPFPDTGPDDAHGGKYELKTHQKDPTVVTDVITAAGFLPICTETDSFREPEIWITVARL